MPVMSASTSNARSRPDWLMWMVVQFFDPVDASNTEDAIFIRLAELNADISGYEYCCCSYCLKHIPQELQIVASNIIREMLPVPNFSDLLAADTDNCPWVYVPPK